MSEQLSAAAQAMGVPEPLVERSARAWADATGQSYEDVLAAWAGGEAPAAAAPSQPPPPEEPEQTPEPQPEAPAEEAPAAQPAPAAPEPELQPAAAAVAPAPERVSPEEALEYPVVVTVPTAGITERTGFSIPMWLGALLLLVPAFGLIYLAVGSGAAECGSGTALRPDRVTGVLENCDGSEFQGRGAGGGGGADFIALGEGLYSSQGCAGCHGPQGGGGVGPALTGVTTTFSSCQDHIEWVQLGSQGFQAEGRSTYGDTDKPVTAGMPGFAGSLSDEQLAAVVAFERVRHAGANPEQVLTDCGLVEGEGGEGGEGGAEEGAEGEGGAEEGAEGGGETTQTTAGAEASNARHSG